MQCPNCRHIHTEQPGGWNYHTGPIRGVNAPFDVSTLVPFITPERQHELLPTEAARETQAVMAGWAPPSPHTPASLTHSPISPHPMLVPSMQWLYESREREGEETDEEEEDEQEAQINAMLAPPHPDLRDGAWMVGYGEDGEVRGWDRRVPFPDFSAEGRRWTFGHREEEEAAGSDPEEGDEEGEHMGDDVRGHGGWFVEGDEEGDEGEEGEEDEDDEAGTLADDDEEQLDIAEPASPDMFPQAPNASHMHTTAPFYHPSLQLSPVPPVQAYRQSFIRSLSPDTDQRSSTSQHDNLATRISHWPYPWTPLLEYPRGYDIHVCPNGRAELRRSRSNPDEYWSDHESPEGTSSPSSARDRNAIPEPIQHSDVPLAPVHMPHFHNREQSTPQMARTASNDGSTSSDGTAASDGAFGQFGEINRNLPPPPTPAPPPPPPTLPTTPFTPSPSPPFEPSEPVTHMRESLHLLRRQSEDRVREGRGVNGRIQRLRNEAGYMPSLVAAMRGEMRAVRGEEGEVGLVLGEGWSSESEEGEDDAEGGEEADESEGEEVHSQPSIPHPYHHQSPQQTFTATSLCQEDRRCGTCTECMNARATQAVVSGQQAAVTAERLLREMEGMQSALNCLGFGRGRRVGGGAAGCVGSVGGVVVGAEIFEWLLGGGSGGVGRDGGGDWGRRQRTARRVRRFPVRIDDEEFGIGGGEAEVGGGGGGGSSRGSSSSMRGNANDASRTDVLDSGHASRFWEGNGDGSGADGDGHSPERSPLGVQLRPVLPIPPRPNHIIPNNGNGSNSNPNTQHNPPRTFATPHPRLRPPRHSHNENTTRIPSVGLHRASTFDGTSLRSTVDARPPPSIGLPDRFSFDESGFLRAAEMERRREGEVGSSRGRAAYQGMMGAGFEGEASNTPGLWSRVMGRRRSGPWREDGGGGAGMFGNGHPGWSAGGARRRSRGLMGGGEERGREGGDGGRFLVRGGENEARGASYEELVRRVRSERDRQPRGVRGEVYRHSQGAEGLGLNASGRSHASISPNGHSSRQNVHHHHHHQHAHPVHPHHARPLHPHLQPQFIPQPPPPPPPQQQQQSQQPTTITLGNDGVMHVLPDPPFLHVPFNPLPGSPQPSAGTPQQQGNGWMRGGGGGVRSGAQGREERQECRGRLWDLAAGGGNGGGGGGVAGVGGFGVV
ncbi:hypothetical protein HDV00_007048 [Rhizophlyctis rosea]|nr:hypothetical protein HDV00_007048 [Rhizophlyctis rosea]